MLKSWMPTVIFISIYKKEELADQAEIQCHQKSLDKTKNKWKEEEETDATEIISKDILIGLIIITVQQ